MQNEVITRRLDQIGYGHYEVDDHDDANSMLQRSDDIDLFEDNNGRCLFSLHFLFKVTKRDFLIYIFLYTPLLRSTQ